MDKMDKKDPHSAERQLFQLQKKGFEDINKNLETLKAPDISTLQKTLEEIRDKEVAEFPAAVEEVTVKNQLDLHTLEEGVSSVIKAIEDKKFASTDTAPIEALLKDILDKKDTETDLAPVIAALKDITNFLKETPKTAGIDYTKDFKELARVIMASRPGSAGFNPGSMGVKNVAGNEVNPATAEKQDTIIAAVTAPTTVAHALVTVTTAGTRVQLATTTAKSITVKALSTNTGIIYVGNSTVASSNGFPLSAGDTVSLDISNTNVVWIDSSVNGEKANWVSNN